MFPAVLLLSDLLFQFGQLRGLLSEQFRLLLQLALAVVDAAQFAAKFIGQRECLFGERFFHAPQSCALFVEQSARTSAVAIEG